MQTVGFLQKSLMVVLLVTAVPGLAQSAAGTNTAASVSPGPPLWKVSKESHSLWIFGILMPLEAGINWRSEAVESVIGQAQEYIYIKTPEPKIPLNPVKLINGLRLVLKIRNNPEGKRLEEVIPADLYSRFSRLVDLYQIPDDVVEKTRPYYAADSLRGWAVIANELTEDHGVDIKIENLVSSNASITRTPINLGPEYLDYDFIRGSALALSDRAALENEINCLKLSVESVATDMAGMHLRARAWAEGNVDILRRNPDPIGAVNACKQVIFGLDGTSNILEEANEAWLRAAELALSSNITSFAVLELDQLISGNGVLEALRNRGYTIEEP